MGQTNMEIRVAQKRRLYSLYKIRRRNPDLKIVGLDDEINEAETEMEQEDVVLVKEKVNELEI